MNIGKSKDECKKIKYNENLTKFYKSPYGYDTEEEALFRFYLDKMKSLNININAYKEIIKEYEDEIIKIKNDNHELFIKFSEELL